MAPGTLADSPTKETAIKLEQHRTNQDKKPDDQLDALAITEQVTRTPDRRHDQETGQPEKKGIAWPRARADLKSRADGSFPGIIPKTKKAIRKDRLLSPAQRGFCLVGTIGLEPTTPTMSRWCSNQLSYVPVDGRAFYGLALTCQHLFPLTD